MKLNYEGLLDRAGWEKAGVKLPEFDCKAMLAATEEAPVWVHIGAGNIFRAFIARAQQKLLNGGLAKSGIVAVSTHNAHIINKVYKPYDNMCVLVGLRADGTMRKEIIASVADSLTVNLDNPQDREKLKKIFRNPSLQIVSYTITEKGYALKDIQDNYLPLVEADFTAGPEGCAHGMSLTAAMLYERFKACGAPVAVVSMDNCSHNGEKVRTSVVTVAKKWLENGFVTADFIAWLEDEKNVSFPWSMIDKITPRPAQNIADALAADGIEGMEIVETSRNKYDSAFVNAEEPEYLVIEDNFPNGRPPLEKAGIYLTDRDTVNNTEKMKVTTCLNPLHTALAVYGCLLGYKTIASEMTDPDLKKLVERIGYQEGLPVVVDPGIIRPANFINEVLTQRLPNPFMPDAPQRIATDTSQKVGVRFGETIKSYIAAPDRDVTSLTYIPLAIAGWMRYLIAVDDNGEPMTCSSDPMLDALQAQLSGVKLGEPDSASGKLDGILSNVRIFGVDLVAAGLSEKIEEMLRKMLAGPGAVRATLKEYLAD